MTNKQKLLIQAQRNLSALREAVREEMEKRAKLGLTAVVADENGRPIHVPAAELLARFAQPEQSDQPVTPAKGRPLDDKE